MTWEFPQNPILGAIPAGTADPELVGASQKGVSCQPNLSNVFLLALRWSHRQSLSKHGSFVVLIMLEGVSLGGAGRWRGSVHFEKESARTPEVLCISSTAPFVMEIMALFFRNGGMHKPRKISCQLVLSGSPSV